MKKVWIDNKNTKVIKKDSDSSNDGSQEDSKIYFLF